MNKESKSEDGETLGNEVDLPGMTIPPKEVLLPCALCKVS